MDEVEKMISDRELYVRAILAAVDKTEKTLGPCVELAYCREQVELALAELAEMRAERRHD